MKSHVVGLVFLGDITVSQPVRLSPDRFPVSWNADITMANLEGPLRTRPPDGAITLSNGVYNTPEVLDVLKHYKVNAICLANNHTLDGSLPIEVTRRQLADNNITPFGAGINLRAANSPFVYKGINGSVKVFAFGWHTIGCVTATNKREGVSPLSPEYMLSTIRQVREKDPRSFVVFFLHWNYELELFPQPAHRQLAHDLIKEGVDAIVGLHPHVVQGAESINGKPVIYSLGNWYFPPRQLGQFRLAFPPITHRELALELEVDGREVHNVSFHWHQFDPDELTLSHERTEGWDGQILEDLTPFKGMSHREYCNWFRINRARRRGLPIYYNYDHYWRNRGKDFYVKMRQRFVELLVRLNLKQGING